MTGKPFKQGNSETDARRQKFLYGATRKEVADKQMKLLRELATGTHFDLGTAMLGEYLEHWLETVAWQRVRETIYIAH